MIFQSACLPAFSKKGIALFAVLIVAFLLFFHPALAQANNLQDSLAKDHFFQVIRSGDAFELNKLLENGADPNVVSGICSALMAAALYGSTEQMKILIEHGANVNYVNEDSITALWFAIPNWDKTLLLMNHGADPRIHSKEGYTVLVKLALMPGTVRIFHLLMDQGADLKGAAPDNFLLYNAAGAGDTAVMRLLMQNGFRANDTVFYGDYPINNALNYRCFEAVKMLVDNGANVNVHPSFGLESIRGFTPLMYAALSNERKSFFYLLDHGADPNIKSKKGFTALMLLQQAETDQPDMTLALIQHGAIPYEKAADGTDALYYAQKKGNTESVAILKKYAN